MSRYTIRFSVLLVNRFPELLTLLLREAVRTAQRQEFLRAEEIARRLEALFGGPYGADAPMLQLVRGFLHELFGSFRHDDEALRLWQEHVATFTPDPWDGAALRAAVQLIPAERWLAHREQRQPSSAAALLCDALARAAANRLLEAGAIGHQAYRKAHREQNMPIWVCAHLFLDALFKGFHRQHPHRRTWDKSSEGRQWRPWPGPVLLATALQSLSQPTYSGTNPQLPPLF